MDPQRTDRIQLNVSQNGVSWTALDNSAPPITQTNESTAAASAFATDDSQKFSSDFNGGSFSIPETPKMDSFAGALLDSGGAVTNTADESREAITAFGTDDSNGFTAAPQPDPSPLLDSTPTPETTPAPPSDTSFDSGGSSGGSASTDTDSGFGGGNIDTSSSTDFSGPSDAGFSSGGDSDSF